MAERLLTQVLPELANELASLLNAEGHAALASQVSTLPIVDRCRCGDDFCATFYAVPRPNQPWGPKHENVVLEPALGHLVLDIVDGTIVAVEVLHREHVRRRLIEILP